MAEKRAKKAQEEVIENKANQALRRMADKVRHEKTLSDTPDNVWSKDLNKIKEDMKEKEAIKEAEQRRKGTPARRGCELRKT